MGQYAGARTDGVQHGWDCEKTATKTFKEHSWSLSSCWSLPECPTGCKQKDVVDNFLCQDEVVCSGCCTETTEDIASWFGCQHCQSGWTKTATQKSTRWWSKWCKVTCTGCVGTSDSNSFGHSAARPDEEKEPEAAELGSLIGGVVAVGLCLGVVGVAGVRHKRRRAARAGRQSEEHADADPGTKVEPTPSNAKTPYTRETDGVDV